MKSINIVVVKSSNLLSRDILRGGNKMYHFGHSAIYNVESVKHIVDVVLRCWEFHEVHRNN